MSQVRSVTHVSGLDNEMNGAPEGIRTPDLCLASQALRLGDSKTGYSVRPLGADAMKVLRIAMRRSEGRYVFPSVKGKDKPFVGLPKAWARIVSDGVDLTPHGLRHAFASTAEELGFSVPTISALLGHRSGGVTERYIHKVDTVLVASASRIASHIARAMAGESGGELVELRTA